MLYSTIFGQGGGLTGSDGYIPLARGWLPVMLRKKSLSIAMYIFYTATISFTNGFRFILFDNKKYAE